MASGAILKRKFLSASVRSVHAILKISSGQSTQYIDFCGNSSLANHFSRDHWNDGDINKVFSKKLLRFTTPSNLYMYKFNGIVLPGYRNARLDLSSSLGVRFISQAHYSSAYTQKKPDLDRNDDTGKKRKETSPEECDQESKKFAASVLQRIWSVLFGIGPGIRVVPSMSREDWGKIHVHLKHKFKSMLQHYWLGSKLLWVDVRISSRLLLKLSGGESLSRRERQQLTQTTIIFSGWYLFLYS